VQACGQVDVKEEKCMFDGRKWRSTPFLLTLVAASGIVGGAIIAAVEADRAASRTFEMPRWLRSA
jgi:hypothetical protein